MMFRLAKKVAGITGGASGIGRATADRFVPAGAKGRVGHRSGDGAAPAARLGCEFHSTYVSSEAEVEGLIKECVARFGKLDILINNAGIQPLGIDFDHLTPALLERTFAVNVHGVAFGIKHAARVMKPGSRILNTASFVGLLASPSGTAYSASKAAVIHLTKLGAVELAPRGITVNCVCPGTVLTPAVTEIPDNLAAHTAGPSGPA